MVETMAADASQSQIPLRMADARAELQALGVRTVKSKLHSLVSRAMAGRGFAYSTANEASITSDPVVVRTLSASPWQ